MKKIREHLKVIVIMTLTIGIALQSYSVSSSEMIGQFKIDYSNRSNVPNGVTIGAFPALLLLAAEVIGASYAAGYIAGRLAYVAFGVAIAIDYSKKDVKYDRLAFSQFDN